MATYGPFTISVPGQRVQLGKVFPAKPVQIINDSDSEVWLAPDASRGSGSGTPVKPNTPIVWTTPGEIWATLDIAATEPAVLFMTDDIHSWQPSPTQLAADIALELFAMGIPSVDNPQIVSFSFPDTIGAGATITAPIIDVKRFSSFYSWWGFDAPIGNYFQVTLEWLDNNSTPIDIDAFVINGQGTGSFVVAGGAFCAGPVRGSLCRISVTNLSGVSADFNFTMYGSMRNVARFRCMETTGIGNEGSPVLTLFDLGGGVMPGPSPAIVVQYLPLFAGEVSLSLLPIGTAGQSVRILIRTGPNLGLLFDRTYVLAAAFEIVTLLLPRVACQLEIRNLGASAINGFRGTLTALEP